MEEVVLRDQTDYYGYVAWGEYPHNFAAVLNQEECYRLILAKGGNHDLQDINGCTVTHILVVFDNMKMFDMAVECGAAINIENKLGLTALTMAAYLAKCDMFFHIASIEREVYWQLGNVTCSAYPLRYLDTIHSQTGELQTKSALNLIVFGSKLEHLDLIEYVIVDLLNVKWKSFIKRTFYTQFLTFFLFFCLSSSCFLTRENTPKHGTMGNCTNMTDMINMTFTNMTEELDKQTNEGFLGEHLLKDPGESLIYSIEDGSGAEEALLSLFPDPTDLADFEANIDNNLTNSFNATDDNSADVCQVPQEDHSCFHHTYDTTQKQVRGFCELALVVWGVIYLIKAFHELSFLGKKIFLDNMIMCPSRVIFLCGCIVSILMVPARVLCLPPVEDRLALVVMMCHGPYFLFFCRGIKLVGPMVIMIYRMMAQDLARFGTVFIIFVMGFSQAFFIMFLSFEFDPKLADVEDGKCDTVEEANEDSNCLDNPMPDMSESILVTFLMATGELMKTWSALEHTRHKYIGQIHWFLFVMIVFLLLLNLLIAMMGDTYAKIAAIKNEWMRQWAKTVLITERSIPPAERLRQQDLYCDKNSDGEKALVMKQFLSDEKVEEITEIIEMKLTHRKNIERRKAKFGFDSQSKMGLNMAGAAVIIPDNSDGTDPENPYGDV